MPKSILVLQTENDLFHPDFENNHLSTIYQLPKFPNAFGQSPVNRKIKR